MNERYHTISILAVFLALTTGMVIGAFFLQSPALTTTSNQVKELDARAKQLREEYNRARAKTDSSLNFIRKLGDLYAPKVEPLVRNKLHNRRIALIICGDYADMAANISQTAALAGAEISATLIIDNKKLTEYAKPIILRRLSKLPEGIKSNDLVGISGLAGSTNTFIPPTKLVVVLGGHKIIADTETPDTSYELAIIDQLAKIPDVKVVGAEPLFADYSSVPGFSAKNLPSTDCIDLPVGQITLVHLFNEKSGSYGLKDTANNVFPETIRIKL